MMGIVDYVSEWHFEFFPQSNFYYSNFYAHTLHGCAWSREQVHDNLYPIYSKQEPAAWL